MSINVANYNIEFDNQLMASIKQIKDGGEIIIPRSIQYNSQVYILKKVGSECVCNNNKITSIEFTEDSEVEFIESDAFKSSYLTKIKLPPKVATIQPSTFERSQELKVIEFPPNSMLKTISENSFSAVINLESLVLPSTVETIQEGWCSFTPQLKRVIFSSENQNFKIMENGIIIGKSNPQSDAFDQLLFAPRNIKEVKIPSFIRKICKHAFNGCNLLTSIEFEEKNKGLIIGSWSFAFVGIKKLFLPSFVKRIDSNAFYNLDGKTYWIELSDCSNVDSFDSDIFGYCDVHSLEISGEIIKINVNRFKRPTIFSFPDAKVAHLKGFRYKNCVIFISAGSKIFTSIY